MKILIGYVRSFIREDFSLLYYLTVALYISILLFFGYYFDLENDHLDPLYGTWKHILFVFISFSTAYFGTLIIQSFFRKDRSKLPWKFWVAAIFCILIESNDLSMSWHRNLMAYFPPELRYLLMRSTKNALGLINVLLPFYLYHRFSHSESNFYGLSVKNFTYKPYVLLSAISLVGIALSLYNGDLSSYYPTYKPNMANFFPEQEWIAVIIYESAYAFDFVSVEMVFRGFMVVGLAQWLGKDAVLPMVATYCVLHFGKPLPEAISSIFGGYVLGILAFKSKNILGGVMIHITIALGMEFFSWFLS